ncbi:MAG: FHA domain-containing protein [Lentisphaeria bacterium]|jgi:hypothetical protein|nr:FHA domain-containing protein [Lentisphaeria bacterium]
MKLRILKGPEADRLVDVDPSGFMLGRGKDNHLVLQDEGISRHHCRIKRAEDGWTVEDLGSTNGVRVNGQRIEGPRILANGDLIAICEQELRVEFKNAAPPLAVLPPPAAAILPPAVAGEGLPAAGEGGAEYPPSSSSPLPLGRIALLVAMCLLIGVLVYLLRSSGDGGEPVVAGTAETVEPAVEGAAPPRVLSDRELDELLRQEAAQVVQQAPAAPVAAEAPVAADAPPAAEAPVPAEAPPAAAVGPVDPAASEIVLVRSLPEGATVFIDDEEKGTTPLLVAGLAKGRHRITLKMDGYEDHQRLIHVPDVISSAPYEMRQRPNTLLVTSDPPGVSIWRGSQWLGTAPALLRDLPAGEIALNLAMPGCPPQRAVATISGVRGEQLHVAMKPELGNLEIETLPPGCQVLVDAAPMGLTAGEQTAPGSTGVLRLANLLAGERALRIEHPCGAFLAWKAAIVPGETLRQSRRLWVPDIHLTLIDGVVKTGMLVERNEQGDLVVAQSPLPRDMVRYLKPQVRAERPLGETEVREVFQQALSPEAVAETDGPKAPAAAQWGDETAAEPPAAGGEAVATGPKDQVHELTADELGRQLEALSKSKFMQRYNGATIQVTGRPSAAIRRDGLIGLVQFGRRIRCEIGREVFETHRVKLNSVAEAPNMNLVLRGRVQGFMGDTLILRDCVPVFPEGGRQ